jgi:hypothetical protein
MVLGDIVVNYWAVLVAAVAGFIVGMVWHSPALFGSMWMKLSGITMKKKPEGMGKRMFIALVAMLVMAWVLSNVIGLFDVGTLVGGIQTGFWIWLGFVATIMIGVVLWEGKPFKLFLLNAIHWLVV